MSPTVLWTLNLPFGVMMRSSSMTAFRVSALSSTTTMAERGLVPFHTENHTSSLAALYPGRTTHSGPSPRFAYSAIGSTW